MSTDFCTSKTKDNLFRAFVSECQAYTRYQIAASAADAQKLHSVALLFRSIGEQEKEHAEVFYEHLKQCGGQSIQIDCSFTVDNSENISTLLGSAIDNEQHEHSSVYPMFASIAREEGFDDIAGHFEKIAEIERDHEKRFSTLRGQLDSGSLYSSDKSERWFCTNCGYIYEGTQAPQQCPVCSVEQGYYVRLDTICS